MEESPFDKLVKKYSAFYRTRRFITVITRALPEQDESNPLLTLYP